MVSLSLNSQNSLFYIDSIIMLGLMLSSLGRYFWIQIFPLCLKKWGHLPLSGPLAAPQSHWEQVTQPRESAGSSRSPRSAAGRLSLD